MLFEGRGPIWINLQFLILKKLYSLTSPRAKNIYQRLKQNVVKTVCGNWKETGYFWEIFNEHLDGKGTRNHPFNGWTSLITLIIGDNYFWYSYGLNFKGLFY